jgi:hypothetical protein
MAGMSPSPDWFTGLQHVPLVEEASGILYEHFKLQTFAMDLGIDDGDDYYTTIRNPEVHPPLPIHTVTNTTPRNFFVDASDGVSLQPVAEWECFLVLGEEEGENHFTTKPCDWLLDPCCETAEGSELTRDCDGLLPNGVPPMISLDLQEVLRGVSNQKNTAIIHSSVQDTTTTPSAGADRAPKFWSVNQETCDYANDYCQFEFDKVCDEYDCPGGDCIDCDPCQRYTLDCEACVANGCFWCPGDAICMSFAVDESVWSFYAHKRSSCPTATDWKSTSEDSNPEGNFFSDPLYDAMVWQYDLMNVVDVWKLGLTGAGIHVRVIDVDGVDGNHPEFANNFDVDNSCDVYMPDSALPGFHGTGCASIVAANGK